MKLQKFGTIKYAHNNEDIEIPEYKFVESNKRGCWISNVANIDTPCGLSPEDLKKHLIGVLDNMKSYNMNLAIFQVRPCNDAFYPSTISPWSRFLTGTEGKDPGFDVFGFFCDEAKKRDIKVHAWMNPYRVGQYDIYAKGLTKKQFLDTLSENNWARLHPEHTILDGKNQVILAPAHQEVIDYVTETIMEVARKYDVEGVHIDDYFYPYAKIRDDQEFEDYIIGRLEDESFDDWRRRNVNRMVENIHNNLVKLEKETGKKVLFGISPFAIYRTNSSIKEGGWEKGSYNDAGALEAYNELYSDFYLWMKEGWIDYICPQDYFSFERKDVGYHNVVWWWSQICKETGTILYIGQGIYHAGAKEGWGFDTWQNPEEIANQLKFNCNFDNVSGTVFFTYKDLVPGQNPIKDYALKCVKELWNQKK